MTDPPPETPRRISALVAATDDVEAGSAEVLADGVPMVYRLEDGPST